MLFFYQNWLLLGYLVVFIPFVFIVLLVSPPFSRIFFLFEFYPPLPFLPPALSTFIFIKSEAYRGFSGSFGDFGSIVFIVANQVTSSIVDCENSLLPKIISPLLDRPSLSSFFSTLYFLRLVPALSSSVNGLPSLLLYVTHISSRFPIYCILIYISISSPSSLLIASVSSSSSENHLIHLLFTTSLSSSLSSSLYLILSLL